MATLEQLAEGIRRAHAAGDTENVQKLGAAYRAMQAEASAGGSAAAQANDPYFTDLPVPGTASPMEAPPEMKGGTGPLGNVLQGLSGVNEGVASLLSLPNTVELGLRSIGPATVNALGGDVAMPQESWFPDAGASFRRLGTEIGAIKPESSDPTDRFVRRVGQEVGATLIPALGVPAKGAALASAAGSGVFAATAQQVAPGNDTAETIAQLIGGGSPLFIANSRERAAMRKAAPSIEELRTQAGGLYDAAKASGVTFPQTAVKSAVDDITARALSEGLDETLHPGAVSALKRLQVASGTGMTAQDAQTIRRVIGGAAGNPTNPDQSRIAGIMKRMFDDEITSAIPELAPANALYAQAKKGQMVEDAFTRARDTLGVNYNNAGMVTALRREFKRMIDNPQMARGLSQAETDAIRAFVRGGPVENVLRWAGRHAPTGTLSFGSTIGSGAGLGFLAGSPTLGAAAVGGLAGGGIAARAAGNAMAMKTAEEISAMLRGGTGPIPRIAPNTAQAAAAAGIGQASNQNDKVTQEIIDLLMGGQTQAQLRATALN